MMQFLICESNQNVKVRDKYNRGFEVSTKVDVRKMNALYALSAALLSTCKYNINLSDASLMTML